MTPDWTPLDRELDRWRAAGRMLPVWWRDDDAVAPGARLGELMALSDMTGFPVHLAIIPAQASPALADLVASRQTLIPLVHGWAHRSHAPRGEKKAEFGAHRPLPDMAAEARNGLLRLSALFGPALRPVFVPPWNRIAPEMVALLPALGYRAISTFTPRARAEAAPGLQQINTHLDPIDWRGSRSLADPDRLIAQMAGDLADRREGRADAAEPYGLLTHHLVHDAAIQDFTAALLTRLAAGPVRRWIFPTDPEETT
ncbi:polysaccharide deacetylase family protein [Pseudodonghicola flavimaris]|uniref:Polysaccharide deacetylase family protein n=1 Tax=Pseudodonghicola flavimaris TaxID=3050036 RepID=A0ABT7F353_9RHOB|nr:polysaccharide deacetylase family protein [Pseudodonghicola flavimaris]MDK3019005.1 polysaccharide deacetylase family protein [Pseudodonghicola flavimaris]